MHANADGVTPRSAQHAEGVPGRGEICPWVLRNCASRRFLVPNEACQRLVVTREGIRAAGGGGAAVHRRATGWDTHSSTRGCRQDSGSWRQASSRGQTLACPTQGGIRPVQPGAGDTTSPGSHGTAPPAVMGSQAATRPRADRQSPGRAFARARPTPAPQASRRFRRREASGAPPPLPLPRLPPRTCSWRTFLVFFVFEKKTKGPTSPAL